MSSLKDILTSARESGMVSVPLPLSSSLFRTMSTLTLSSPDVDFKSLRSKSSFLTIRLLTRKTQMMVTVTRKTSQSLGRISLNSTIGVDGSKTMITHVKSAMMSTKKATGNTERRWLHNWYTLRVGSLIARSLVKDVTVSPADGLTRESWLLLVSRMSTWHSVPLVVIT